MTATATARSSWKGSWRCQLLPFLGQTTEGEVEREGGREGGGDVNSDLRRACGEKLTGGLKVFPSVHMGVAHPLRLRPPLFWVGNGGLLL